MWGRGGARTLAPWVPLMESGKALPRDAVAMSGFEWNLPNITLAVVAQELPDFHTSILRVLFLLLVWSNLQLLEGYSDDLFPV